MVSSLLTAACAPVELAETEVPVGKEWTHAERGREAEGLPVAELGAVDIKRTGDARISVEDTTAIAAGVPAAGLV